MKQVSLFFTLSMLAVTALADKTSPLPVQQPALITPHQQPATTPPAQAADIVTPQQWINAGTQNGFPAYREQQLNSSQQQIRSAFPQTNYGAQNYAVAGQNPNGVTIHNGIAPMPPLTPPSAFSQAEQVVSPFTNQEIVRLRKQLDNTRKAKAFRPVRSVPRIRSVSVDLAPGSAPPIVVTLPGEMSALLFMDSTGAPWPLAVVPRVSNTDLFDVEWLQGTPSVIVSALSSYEDGNIIVYLQGLATPIVIKVASGEPDSKEKNRVVDGRLDLRVPGRGPNAHAPLLGPGKIALYDNTMQAFLDGIPPKDAQHVEAQGGDVRIRTQVWQMGGVMYVRTPYEIQTAFDQSIASGDGTRVYRLAPTPYVTLSDEGRSVMLQLDIN